MKLLIPALVTLLIVTVVNAETTDYGSTTRSFCVDFTWSTSSLRRLPSNTKYMRWMVKPKKSYGSCTSQGVLRLKQPSWAKRLTFHMKFNNKPKGYTFDIGDSYTNDGFGNNQKTTRWNAEVHSYYSGFRFYKNYYGGHALTRSVSGAVKTAMIIELHKNGGTMWNYENPIQWISVPYGKGFYWRKNSYIYVGLNRVIRYHTGQPWGKRTGTGLCSMCIYWMST